MTRTKRVAAIAAAAVLMVNALAYLQARAMTHFAAGGAKTAPLTRLSLSRRLCALLGGVNLPHPVDRFTPRDFGLPYRAVSFPGYEGLTTQAWLIPSSPSPASRKGVVVLFHGYGASMSQCLPAASQFHALGYDALLVDFSGSGGSAGEDTSIGYHEADTVAAAALWARSAAGGEAPILYGISMGAAAVLRAVGVLGLEARAVILEAPFDRMLSTVRHRFERQGIPPTPLAPLLVFWGGVREGFNGFRHNPADYARGVRRPALLTYGTLDPYVRRDEIDAVFAGLAGPKTLKIFAGLGHQSFVKARPAEWRGAVDAFLRSLPAARGSGRISL